MKEMKRVLALVLCFVMLVGVVPVGAIAAESETTAPSEALEAQTAEAAAVATTEAATETSVPETTEDPYGIALADEDEIVTYTYTGPDYVDAAVFASDIHDGPSTAKSIMQGVAQSGLTYSTATFVGDTFSDSSGDTSTDVTPYIQEGLGDESVDVLYAWGDHDYKSDIENYTGLLYGDSTTNYYIYTISMSAMTDMEGSKTGLSSTFSDSLLTAFTSAVEEMDHSKPLFIATHMPLHVRRGDNDYAYDWFQVIQTAASQMDVAVFWAHNHTGDDGSNYDSTCYYMEPGTSINIQGADEAQTLNFTYANAGYINPPNGDGRKNVATSVTIFEDSMEFVVYDANGAYSSSTYATGGTVKRSYASSTPVVTLESLSVSGTAEYTVGDTFAEPAVTAVYSDGSTELLTAEDYEVTGTYDMSTAGTYTLTYAYNGVTAEYVFTVAEPAVAPARIEVSGTDAYSVGDDLTLTVKGYTYSTAGLTTVDIDPADCEIAVSCPNGHACTLETVMNTVAEGTDNDYHQITVTYMGVEGSFMFTVGQIEEQKDDTTGVAVAVSPAVTGAVTVAESTNANLASAMASVSVDNYQAYSITTEIAMDAGNYATVTLPIPEGMANPVVYYVSDDGQTVTNMNAAKDGSGNVTFTTTHFSDYVIGESTEITVEDEKTASGSGTTTTTTKKTVYVLTSSISSGSEYLIVNGNSAGSYYALANNSGSVAATGVTVKTDDTIGTYIELDDATDELWTTSGSSSTTLKNGSYYLYYSNQNLSLSTSNSTTWTYSSNRLYRSNNNQNRYLRYNNGWTTTQQQNSASSIYFYIPTEIEVETTTTVSGTYSIKGEDISVVVASDGTTTATLESKLIFTDEDGNETYPEMSTDSITYEVVSVDANGNTVNGDPNGIISNLTKKTGKITFSGSYGTALVKVSYETEFGTVTDYITVTATAPYYTIQLHEAEPTYTLVEDLSEDEFNANEDTIYYYYSQETGGYLIAREWNEDITEYYVISATNLGDEITEPIALKGVDGGDTYSVWAVVKEHTSSGATDMGALGDALTWKVSDTSIATINEDTGVLTFTGENYGTFSVTVYYEGADGIIIEDTITISVTDSLYVVPGDGTNDFPEYPNEGAVRFDKTATAVGNFSETGIAMVELSMTGVPYSTGAAIDALLVLDMSTSMKTEVEDDVTRYYVTGEATKAFIKTIVQNDDGTYNNNTVCVHYFNGTTAYTDKITSGFITISSDAELAAIEAKIDALVASPPSASGTDYTTAMETAYNTIIARDAVSDNTQALVFMSDGGPTYYTYLNDSGTGTEANGSSSGTQGGNGSAGDTIVGWFDIDDNNTDDETDDTATATDDFKEEYYSYLLKNAEPPYPVYTVGLGLAENSTGPSAYTGLTSGAHEAITSYILTSMATDASHFYNIADEDAVDNMGNIFSGIAASIKEAATDVVVEDKIGSEYSVNFSLPTNVTTDETDGLSEFYIQVVDYVLDTTTHERTGVYSVLENVTFTADSSGDLSVKSHTVDGVSCGTSCSHVTITNNEVTAINGTYFTYKKDDTGEYLTWESAKLSSTELALQYFVHLDNSSDAVGSNNEVPAGTYYTNEYATLTYTNYNGNRVQQEFPVPQMTWNGAQVSYVFYLVNDAGQPVNRAGRVVPFAEATYVTDVNTYHIVWNSLEQSAGLEADYLADDLVPDCYALYDDDAEYYIHVYEDEEADNLNNHFTIGGDVTDDYNTVTNSWTNANTTYVFNTKADAKKYNTVGTYIASDGSTTAVTTYLCKGDGTVTATIAQVTVADATAFAAGTYFVMNDSGKYVQAALYDSSATYYAITAASYTAASGETQWTPGSNDSTSGGTVIGGYVYYIDENNKVYTIVQKSNGTEVESGFDFHNTTVAFAVVWKPQLEPDTVVIDYGLDVVIDVTTNDAMAAGVVGVRTDAPSGVTMGSGNYTSGKATATDVSIGDVKVATATVESLTSVRVALDKTNGMQLTDAFSFYYESDVNYYDSNNVLQNTSMYSSVTVIPAANIYYEDDYFTSLTYVSGDTTIEGVGNGGWELEGTKKSVTQATDRPGAAKNMAESYDSDNAYGYDEAYDEFSTYSLGSALKVHVDADSYARAEFQFYGTGFDIISMTSNTTGTLAVRIFDEEGTRVKSVAVDTYYGYSYDWYNVTYVWTGSEWEVASSSWLDGTSPVSGPVDAPADAAAELAKLATNGTTVGETLTVTQMYWQQDNDTDNAMYQVPVIKCSDLDYGKYTVELTATYVSAFDHTEAGNGYDLYLDAVRIYDPTGVVSGVENETVSNAYVKDSEGWPVYSEIRNMIITAADFNALTDGEQTEGVIFLDQQAGTYTLQDYVSYGPNNEMYLAQDQAVAFILNPGNQYSSYSLADVQIGMKSANGKTVNATLTTYDATTFAAKSSTAPITNSNSTDRYYSIGSHVNLSGATVLQIQNTGAGVLSLTNIKLTFKEAPTVNSAGSGTFAMTRSVADGILLAMNTEDEVVEETEPVVLPDAELNVSVKKTTVKEGSNVQVKVTTSDAVEMLDVNGKTVTTYKVDRKTGKRTWTVDVKAEEAGALEILVNARDAEGTVLATSSTTVTVTENQSTDINKIIGQLLGKLFG